MEKLYFIVLCLVAFSASLIGITAQTTSTQPETARCFQFTWLGPRYNNDSVFMNATCEDATQLASGIPCHLPLVASYDGSWPDVDYIWNNFADHTTCILAENDVCAQFTYYFDNIAENSTYMCTRAIDVLGGPPITSGCYEQRDGNFAVRACFCQTARGAMPCNDASLPTITPLLSIALFVKYIINQIVT